MRACTARRISTRGVRVCCRNVSRDVPVNCRLHWEMLALIPTAFKPRIIAPAPVEREFAAWIGGSILGALGGSRAAAVTITA